MKIAVTGTRGIPDIQGGVETHCQELYPLLVSRGVDVTLFRRKHYSEAVSSSRGLKMWKGIRLSDLYAPHKKSLEAIVHTALAICKARLCGVRIVHIHSIGPAIMTPLARLLGMKVVMTHHGPDYERDKWGALASYMLRLGERMGARWANKVIAISPHIAKIIKDRHGVEPVIIPNGVPSPIVPYNADQIISQWGLSSRMYVVALGRFVPEKRFTLLIDAFTQLCDVEAIPQEFKLVIAGDADHPDHYSEELKAMARKYNDRVILTGFIKGEKLQALMASAALFAMPSSHEGLPIALLEAMSYGLDVAVSDIEACRLPELEPSDFFTLDSIQELKEILIKKINRPYKPRRYFLDRYRWPSIADATLAVYKSIL
ncbi:MAG: glycosyltransferase family 4 protein [Alloprevotella sp.]|nr:glycosyltransferase family 4 protein [Alloprevotella sp.]